MANDMQQLRAALVAATNVMKEHIKALNSLHAATVAFHREWSLELKRLRGECTCPWRSNYLSEASYGHHRLCPSLKEEHTVDDGCGLPYGHRDKEH